MNLILERNQNQPTMRMKFRTRVIRILKKKKNVIKKGQISLAIEEMM